MIENDNVRIERFKLETGKAICFDFDGVIHLYRKGWRDGSIYDEPNWEMIDLIKLLQQKGIPVFICSTRDPEQIIEWWIIKKIPLYSRTISPGDIFWSDISTVGVTNRKLPAQLYIDDRAFRYDGQDCISMMNAIKEIQRPVISDYFEEETIQSPPEALEKSFNEKGRISKLIRILIKRINIFLILFN